MNHYLAHQTNGSESSSKRDPVNVNDTLTADMTDSNAAGAVPGQDLQSESARSISVDQEESATENPVDSNQSSLESVSNQQRILQKLVLAGLPILKTSTDGKIHYKLAHGIPANSLPAGQREQLMNELKIMHAEDLKANQNQFSSSGISGSTNDASAQSSPSTPAPAASTDGSGGNDAHRNLNQLEISDILRKIKRNTMEALHEDQAVVLKPDLSYFDSYEDVLKRLLPYHIYQYPEKELNYNSEDFKRKIDRNHEHFIKKILEFDGKIEFIRKKFNEDPCKSSSIWLERLSLDEERLHLQNLKKEFAERSQE